MTEVRIYRPSKSAMQSGRINTRQWVLEYEPGARKETDPLMGWIGSADTRGQVRLQFNSREEAVAFAKKNGLTFRLQDSKAQRVKPKNYAENFSFRRPF